MSFENLFELLSVIWAIYQFTNSVLVVPTKFTRKKHPQIKLQRFQKVWIWTFGWLVHQVNSLYKVLKMKQSFWKSKIVTGKMTFFVSILYSPFYLLTEQFCMEMLRFQSYYFQLKNGTPVFWKGFAIFRKLVLKLKHWKCSKFSVT